MCAQEAMSWFISSHRLI